MNANVDVYIWVYNFFHELLVGKVYIQILSFETPEANLISLEKLL